MSKPTYEELEATVTNLTAQVQGLSADNSALKGFITDDCWVYDKVDERYRGAVYCIPKTPHTYAALAEMRAQGVEMFVSALQKHVDEGDFVGDEIAVITGAIDAGGEFSEQLRKEQGK